jgi:hypothetical protein
MRRASRDDEAVRSNAAVVLTRLIGSETIYPAGDDSPTAAVVAKVEYFMAFA